MVGKAALEGKIVISNEVDFPEKANVFDNIFQEEGYSSCFAAPLMSKGEVLGVLLVCSKEAFTPNQEWLDFLDALARQAAIAVDNALLFEDVQRANFELMLAYNSTLEGWAKALELRDKETEGHSERVTYLTIQLARVVGVPDEELIHIRRGALLHDIGKMAIPDKILLKPGKLTNEEMDVIKKHPEYAFQLLSKISFLKPALDIPLYHHERWDGSGYPYGLKGEEIPLAARIFAVVDVWDAMTSDRPYRKAFSEEEVLDHIRKQSGKHFDPKVVDAFLQLIAELKARES